MRISIDTDREEIEEIRHAIAILEDVIKRREDPDSDYEEENDSEGDSEEDLNESGSFEPEQKKETSVEQPKVSEEPKPFTPAQTFTPPAQSFTAPPVQPVQKEVRRQTQPDFDMSALTMSTRTSGSSSSSRPSSSGGSSMSSRPIGSASLPTRQNESISSYQRPSQDNKSAVKNIVSDLRNRSHGQPIQMSSIVNMARDKNISEQETKNIVSELQREGAI